MIISKTGYSHGFGSAKYKTVAGLTKDERDAIRAGEVVLIANCPLSGGGNHTGTTYRQVYTSGGKFYHRVPGLEILKELGG